MTHIDREQLRVEDYGADPGAYLIYLIHLIAYRWIKPIANGKRVLDLGCGTGYGAYELAETAASVKGIDISAQAIRDARSNYKAENLHFCQIKPVEDKPLPFSDFSFDVAILNQVIEHVPDASACLREIGRVLAPGGLIFIVTPDRTMRLFPGQRPWNRYHRTEYTRGGLAAIAAEHFADVKTYGITGSEPVMRIERKRALALRVSTLPFTFPGAPEWWRQFGLRTLKSMKRPSPPQPIMFGADALWIAETISPSLSIVLKAVKAPTDRARESALLSS